MHAIASDRKWQRRDGMLNALELHGNAEPALRRDPPRIAGRAAVVADRELVREEPEELG